MVLACAVRKAVMMPEPGPISTARGGGEDEGEEEGGEKRACRNAVSDGEDRVSSSRKESSAGS